MAASIYLIMIFSLSWKNQKIVISLMAILVYLRGKDLPKIKEDLIYSIKNIQIWFVENSLKANPEKIWFRIFGDKTCHEQLSLM